MLYKLKNQLIFAMRENAWGGLRKCASNERMREAHGNLMNDARMCANKRETYAMIHMSSN